MCRRKERQIASDTDVYVYDSKQTMRAQNGPIEPKKFKQIPNRMHIHIIVCDKLLCIHLTNRPTGCAIIGINISLHPNQLCGERSPSHMQTSYTFLYNPLTVHVSCVYICTQIVFSRIINNRFFFSPVLHLRYSFCISGLWCSRRFSCPYLCVCVCV